MQDQNTLDNFILREVGTLARSIQSISDIKFKEINLQRGQFIFLTRVFENPGINQIDLSNLLKVDKATTTKAMQKLVDEGYITKIRDEIDKRMWRLYPTDQAKSVYAMIIEEENRNISVCFSDLTEGEQQLVYRLVKKMRENIEQDWKKLKNF
ncbi:MarR family winged helix-turn-helix transcriptional regulator [Desulfitobacterium sp. AusDCA]|uniref:MarR family winged helix-turn-helix transcriptional regulator n=1 Tax=Desulfitobacterium sp. AusDCA TaxID=3240383 RepID=UPI003DA6FC65